MLETKYVGDRSSHFGNWHSLSLNIASGTTIPEMSPTSKFCHQNPKIVTNYRSPTSQYRQHHCGRKPLQFTSYETHFCYFQETLVGSSQSVDLFRLTLKGGNSSLDPICLSTFSWYFLGKLEIQSKTFGLAFNVIFSTRFNDFNGILKIRGSQAGQIFIIVVLVRPWRTLRATTEPLRSIWWIWPSTVMVKMIHPGARWDHPLDSTDKSLE